MLLRKKILVFCILLIIALANITGCYAETTNKNSVYELYKTENFYNFLKLNTRDGRITQVQYAINNDSARFECVINSEPLVDFEQAQNGRFKLYPTKNYYTFLLLDTINGRTWQVQWSIDDDKRGIIGEIK